MYCSDDAFAVHRQDAIVDFGSQELTNITYRHYFCCGLYFCSSEATTSYGGMQGSLRLDRVAKPDGECNSCLVWTGQCYSCIPVYVLVLVRASSAYTVSETIIMMLCRFDELLAARARRFVAKFREAKRAHGVKLQTFILLLSVQYII